MESKLPMSVADSADMVGLYGERRRYSLTALIDNVVNRVTVLPCHDLLHRAIILLYHTTTHISQPVPLGLVCSLAVYSTSVGKSMWQQFEHTPC